MIVEIDYTNWRGERRKRRIRPYHRHLRYGTTKYHPTPGWLIQARDEEDKRIKEFALSGIHSWVEVNPLPSNT